MNNQINPQSPFGSESIGGLHLFIRRAGLCAALMIPFIARFAAAADGNADPGFNPNANGTVYGTSLQPDGKIVIGGSFTTVGGTPRNFCARLLADGTLDPGFNPDANGLIFSGAPLADGKFLIGGSFTDLGGTPRNDIARFHANGTLDASFNLNPGGAVLSMAGQADGRIVIGGSFGVRRLDANGTLEAGVNPTINDNVRSVMVQADGKIVMAGLFTMVHGATRNHVARLLPDGTLDAGFNPDVDDEVVNLSQQADGKIVIAGRFTSVGGAPRSYLARLHINGTLDTSFNPTPGGIVWNTALQADGKILFSSGGFARLHADGTADTTFNAAVGDRVFGTQIQADGRIVAGGEFGSIGGAARSGIARLLNGPATQTLTVPSAARVEWWRGGTAPETTQVAFELSTDGTTWTPLGPGTRISGGWELTGLSLPAKGRIRARARIAGGVYNGGCGMIEQEEAFPPGPTIVVDAVPRLRFTGVPGCTYDVQRAPTLNGPWTTIATITAPAGGFIEYIDTNPPAGPSFYRTYTP